jgi:prophage maintenance system killer protein
MSDYFSSAEIEEIISYNYDLLRKRNEKFEEVERDVLERIFSTVNSYGNTATDKRTTIIKKTSVIIGGITWAQPFFDGNKETAIAVGVLFLYRNGYDLLVEKCKEPLYDLLQKTMNKPHKDKTLYSEIEVFLDKNVITKTK